MVCDSVPSSQMLRLSVSTSDDRSTRFCASKRTRRIRCENEVLLRLVWGSTIQMMSCFRDECGVARDRAPSMHASPLSLLTDARP